MTANLRLSYFLPAIIVLVLAAIFWSYLGEIKDGKSIQDLPSALINKPAPTFKLPGISAGDKGFDSASLKGKVTLVNVWASWCPPCRVEHPRIMQLAREGIPIYGINYKDKPNDAKGFLAELGNPYKAIGADRTGKIAIDWGVYGYPETFVVDAKGHIRYRHVGPIMAHDLTDKIRPLIKALSK
ncbi:MAG: DsbE family thiol:disulfide interchange protein [Alphaproteobacteria bacterium]|nr:DsbE family thiol:disulfide interchange protein [Alphaproteobacteria bacterium]